MHKYEKPCNKRVAKNNIGTSPLDFINPRSKMREKRNDRCQRKRAKLHRVLQHCVPSLTSICQKFGFPVCPSRNRAALRGSLPFHNRFE